MLIPKYSSVGAALATVIVTMVISIFSTGFLFKILKENKRE